MVEDKGLDEVFVSVVMPVRNEESFIALSLNAVLHQDYPQERMEILVADGDSEDATRAIIQALPGAERVQLIRNPRRTQAAGMNAAIRRARGDVIVRVDGHTVIAPDYVRQCVIALRRTGAHNVGGAMIPVGVTDEGKAIAAATMSAFAVPTAFHTNRVGRFTDTVYMVAPGPLLGAQLSQQLDRLPTPARTLFCPRGSATYPLLGHNGNPRDNRSTRCCSRRRSSSAPAWGAW